MYKKIFIIFITGLFLFGMTSFSWAKEMMHSDKMQLAQAESTLEVTVEKEAVDVGNKICPISGEEIDEKTKFTYEHEGKIYNFCCPMCIDEFKKDPEKYIKKIEEMQESEQEGTAAEEHQEGETGEHESHEYHHH